MAISQIRRSRHKGELRKGYTTGACATASALAAMYSLLDGTQDPEVNILLPIGERVSFAVTHYQQGKASVIKDAGDDPDCTHGAEIGATLQLFDLSSPQMPKIRFKAGVGVATVTKAGLELEVGEPAINPVPRQMIQHHLLPLLPANKGVEVEIWIPNGVVLAEQTIGRRLGLVGGLSILGTRGTVHPYSTSAYAASVRQGIEVARAQGLTEMALTTGSRTEKAAMVMNPRWPDTAFIQAGDFCGVGLRAGVRYGAEKLTLVTMIGKLCKLASGTMMTHVSGRAIDFEMISQLVAQIGGQADLIEQVRSANTGRHLFCLIPSELQPALWQALCQAAARHGYDYAHQKLTVETQLLDFDGSLLASATYPPLSSPLSNIE